MAELDIHSALHAYANASHCYLTVASPCPPLCVVAWWRRGRYDFLLVVLRFYVAEMGRTQQLLKSKYTQAAQKAEADSAGGASQVPQGELSGAAVRSLLKSLDTPFQVASNKSSLPR